MDLLVLWLLIAEKAKLVMTGPHHLKIQERVDIIFAQRFYSYSDFGIKCETDQAAISNARWKEGRKETEGRPSHIFIIYHLAAAFRLTGENMRGVKIPPNPTNTPC